MAELDARVYTVAWIAPLEIEAQAALHMLDNRHPGRFRMERGDDYVFQAGDACGHNIIIATLPAGELYGTGSAAALANQVKKFFPNLWFGLLVGVAAGLPNLTPYPPLDIRLGDVLVGLPVGDNAGLIPYDLGKETGNDGFQLLRAGHGLARTETVVRSAIGSIKLLAPNDADEILRHYRRIEHKEHALGTFADPGQERDILYQVDERGIESLVHREQRPLSKRTRIWYGSIGSGDKLMKNAQKRNQLRDKYGLIGLEMEAAGTMDRIPVGVFRGVCDYGDEHKNKEWQPYAAAMAASYARAILAKIGPTAMSQGVNSSISRKRNLDEGNCVSTPEDERNKRPYYGGPSTDMQDTRASGDGGINSDKEQPVPEAVDMMEAATTKSLLEQLYFEKIDERLVNLTAAQGRTCYWFLDKPEYKSWNDPLQQPVHGGFLWISGHPGTGKSTLMKFLFEKEKSNAKARPLQILLSFFFLARGTVEEKSATGLYRSLLHQLFEKAPETQNGLDWMTTDGAKILRRNGWNEQALKQTLLHAVQKLKDRSLMIFVDALDECNRAQVADMVCFFEDLCDRAQRSGVWLQICFSSRYYPIVVIRRGLEIKLEKETGHTEDIEHYIKSTLRLGKSNQADLLRSEILSKSSGIFLWAVLVLRILNQEYPNSSVSINRIRDRLKDIPPELNNLFEMILTRDNDNLDRLHICLKWILFATRPLKPQVLYFAVQFGSDKESTGYWDRDEIELDEMKTFVTSSSKGLAEITRNKASEVQFIHESVRDFLQSRYEAQWSGTSADFVGNSHILLRDCCWTQLRNVIPESIGIEDPLPQGSEIITAREKVNSDYPFLEYATLNLLHHADRAQHNRIDQRQFLATFFLTKWILFNNFIEKHQVRRYTKSVSLLYILAERNLAHLIQIHPGGSSCFDIEPLDERYGTPIFAALAMGSREAVWALLRRQADALPLDSPFHRLLELYCRDRNRPTNLGRQFSFSRRRGVCPYFEEEDETLITSFVLTSGEDPMEMILNHQHILVWAAIKGYEVIVKFFLDADFYLGQFNGRLLLEAAEKGHETIVKLLLEDNATDVNVQTSYGESAFYKATREGHEGIIRLFLQNAAIDNSVQDASGRPALHIAAEQGHTAIVRLFLRNNAIANNVQDASGRSALQVALEQGHNAIVKLFLENNAIDINIQDASGRSALHIAAKQGHTATIRLFLENDAIDINVQDASGRSPLHVAAEQGHEAAVALFLENPRANLNIQTAYGESPLFMAANKGHEAVVSLFLEHNVIDINVQDASGRSPIHVAAEQGHKAVVELFLRNHAADLDIQTVNGDSPLLMAARRGHTAVVKLLLEMEAINPELRNSNGDSPLLVAAERGHEAVARLLLEKNVVDPNVRNSHGDSPLLVAARGGHEAIVRLLLEKDATDRNARDRSGRSPLELAFSQLHTIGIKLPEGFDFNYGLTDFWTVVTHAITSGNELVFRLLIEQCGLAVDQEDQGHLGRLLLDVQTDNEAAVESLLSAVGVLTGGSIISVSRILRLTSAQGHAATVMLLLSANVGGEDAANVSSGKALLYAVDEGHESVVRELLAITGIDLNHSDRFGRTALSIAAERGNDTIMRLLLAKGDVDLNHQDTSGATALIIAARHGYDTIVELLITQSSIEIDGKDGYGLTALSRAAATGNNAVIGLLLGKNGIDVNHLDDCGQTPLALAARYGHTFAAKLLCENSNVRMDLPDYSGRTPLLLASASGHNAVAGLLLEKGVDMHFADKQGQTPLSIARERGHSNTIKLLESYEDQRS